MELLAVSIIGSMAFVLSLFLTRGLIKQSAFLGMIDRPNERSSHQRPVPKGGGLGFFVVFTFAVILLYTIMPAYREVVSPLLSGGPVVVVLGWLDDRFELSALFRLGVHFAVALVIYAFVSQGFTQPLAISFLPHMVWINSAFCVFYIAWFINLYNFMDGADGLAASTAVAASALLAIICLFHSSLEIAMIYCLIAYTVSGFLFYNWSPAKIFMGDTGSYFLGFLFASLALIGKSQANISFYSSVTIFGFFIVDATYILFHRAITRKPLFHAHKTFTFHKLMAKGWSHGKISAFYTMVLVLWLFPMANLASIYDNYGLPIVGVAYLPLLVIALYNRAGEVD